MTDPVSKRPSKKKRPRRVIKALVASVVIVCILVAAAPTLLSFVLGKGMIENAIASDVNGSVSIHSVGLSWFGTQRIEGLVIEADDGSATATANVEIGVGLFSLATGGSNYGTITLSGDLSGVRYEDGTTSFQKLLKKRDRDPDRERRERERKKREKHGSDQFEMRATLIVDGVNVTIDDRSADEILTLSDLNGTFDFDPRGTSSIDLAAVARMGGKSGSIDIEGTVADIFNETGSFDAALAKVDLEVALTQFPVAILDVMAGTGNRATALFGPVIHDMTVQLNGSMQRADGSLSFSCPGVDASGPFQIRDSRFRVNADQPLTIAAAFNNAVLDALATRNGHVVRIAGDGARVTLELLHVDVPIPLGHGLDLAGGSIEATLTARPLSLSLTGLEGVEQIDIEQFAASILSDDLTADISIVTDAAAVLNGNDSSTLHIALDANQFVQPNGEMTFDPARLRGEIDGTSLPSALLQQFMDNTPFILAREVGSTLDLHATFSEGERSTIDATLTAENLSAELRAEVSADGAIEGKTLRVATELKRGLVSEFISAPLTLPKQAILEVTEFSVPATERTGGFDLRRIAARGKLWLEGEQMTVNPRKEEGEHPDAVKRARSFDLGNLSLDFSSNRLGDGMKINSAIVASGATIDIDQRITSLFDDDGGLNIAAALPIGTITIAEVTGAQIGAYLPNYAATVDAILGDPLVVTITTTATAQGQDLKAMIECESTGFNGSFEVIGNGDSLRMTAGTINLDVSPDVLATLRPDDPDEPSVLAIAADKLRIDIEPVVLAFRAGEAWQVAEGPMTVHMSAKSVSISNVAGLKKPLQLRSFVAELSAQFGEPASYAAKGSADLRSLKKRTSIGSLTFDAVIARVDNDASFHPQASLTLTDVKTADLDLLLDRKEPFIARWLGEQGDLSLHAIPLEGGGYEASVTTEFPNLSGEFGVRVVDDTLSVTTPKKPTLTLEPATIEAFLNAPPDSAGRRDAEAAVAQPTARITVQRAVPVVFDVTTLSIPLGMLNGEPIDPAIAVIDLSLSTQSSVVLQRTQDGLDPIDATFRKFDIAVSTKDMNQLNYTISGVLRTASGEQRDRSSVDISGTILNLVDKKSRFALANASIDLKANVNEFPTWVFDTFAQNASLFGDAFGKTMSATITSTNFSPGSGKLIADATSANGSAAHAEIAGRNRGIKTQKNKPLTAELTFTEELGKRLLYQTNPLFEGVKTTGDKVRITVTNAFVPVDDRMRRLNADITIEVGEIELDNTNQVVRLLKLVNATEQKTVAGYVHPLELKIRNGKITYNEFIVEIGRKGRHANEYRHRIVFSGEINMVTKHVNEIVGMFPIASLGESVGALPPLFDNANIGIKFEGDLYDKKGNPKELNWKPEFKLGGGGGKKDGKNPLDYIGDILNDGGSQGKQRGDGGSGEK